MLKWILNSNVAALVILLCLTAVLALVATIVGIIWVLVRPWRIAHRSTVGRSVSTAVIVFIVGTLAYIGYRQFLDWRGEENFAGLMARNGPARLTRFDIEGQQRRITCSDPILVGIFEDAIRDHRPRPDRSGYSYDIVLTFDDGGTCRTWMQAEPDFLLIWHGMPGDCGDCRRLALSAETHPKIAELLEFLQRSWQEAQGQSLDLHS